MLLDTSERTIEKSQSPLQFLPEDSPLSQWDRYLAINGQRAFHIGNVCGTCEFFFERMEGATQGVSPQQVASELNVGLSSIDPALLDDVEKIVPQGTYRVLLLQVQPKLVVPGDENDYFTNEQVELWGIDSFWGLPHSPKTEYYRLSTVPLPARQSQFEFLVPTFPHNWLNLERVAEYEANLQQGERPTAIALSVLDVKGPADWEGHKEVVEHVCLAHYLIDGHHKSYAAARCSHTMTLLSFLAVEQSVATGEDIDALLVRMQ